MARPTSLVDPRVIYCGDNLEQLKSLPPACVDLIYIDPARRRRSLAMRSPAPGCAAEFRRAAAAPLPDLVQMRVFLVGEHAGGEEFRPY